LQCYAGGFAVLSGQGEITNDAYNGYTKDLSPEEKLKNEIEAIKSILQDDPNNEYWQNRLTR
jgi:hypothetical protein